MARFSVLPVVLCLLLLAVHPALGQTPPPPPGPATTPTFTPIPPGGTPAPDAMALLKQMRAAITAAGTLKFRFQSTVVAPGKHQVDITTSGVAAITPNSFHEATTVVRARLDRSPHTSLMERSELEAVGRRAAWRVPNMRWQCESVPDTNLNSELLSLELKPRSAQVVGVTTVGGTPVTRLNAKGTLYPWTGNQTDAVEVDLVPATSIPLRISATVHTTLNGSSATQTLTETYSGYGAGVHITVPKACT